MTSNFKALVIDKVDGQKVVDFVTLAATDLPDEEVLVDVAYSTLNYKDGLAISSHSPVDVAQRVPMVAGIDLAGTVSESSNPKWNVGDRVLVNGFGLSEQYWGGYAQKAKVKSEWLVSVPESLSLEQAMAFGTAGYTAMLCVQAVEDHGVVPGSGPILVTGASGGVGSIVVMLLDALGHEVVASTGRIDENESFLKELGANRLIERSELARESQPMEMEVWSAVVDCVGSMTLATAIAQTKYDGIVAMTGLAGGMDLSTTVMPFILRGVTLRGIDSVQAPLDRRQRAWDRIASLVDTEKLSKIYSVEPFDRIPALADEILAGAVRGRIVIDVNA